MVAKIHEPWQVALYFSSGQRWRLVYDETYTSARKRRQAGTTALEDVAPTPCALDDETESSDATST